MDYPDKVLGIKVVYENVEFQHLPNLYPQGIIAYRRWQ